MSDLLKINVNEHTEKKGGLTYLSWAWAWAEVLKVDPAAYWEPMDFNAEHGPFKLLCQMDDGTAFVGVTVRIQGRERRCMLPVMNHQNKAIPKPNAFDVNKAQMRCLAKAIAMHGLGLYIYAGEDLPEGAPEPTSDEALVPALEASIALARETKLGARAAAGKEAAERLDDNTRVSLRKLGVKVEATASVPEAFDLIKEQGLTDDERAYLWDHLSSKIRSALKQEGQIRALKQHQPETVS